MEGEKNPTRSTLAAAAEARAAAEAEILATLNRLCDATGLDLRGVEIYLVVLQDSRGEPQSRPTAVRIDLTV